ncbi:glutamine synthetase/guanido kinase [Myriangium duriaei CBS 260.36]|uniref:Glutamine synthetase n=1 Tax=Myriangium duriaei CBS 260.36 TaxID=1168546 RepID=A0A9P4JAJ4_9PEZI|nr:glutamine synthetase/guanido kinase [Myriangium duriaei CBS 260.36]
MALPDELLSELRNAIDSCPIVDNHAHNLLRSDRQDAYSLLECTTEARGEALKDTPRSLAHLRAVKQLRELYDCDASATWDDLLEKRHELLQGDSNFLNRKCLAGTHTILLDDGIDKENTVHSYKWHDQFTIGKTRRIVRIETLAADIMKALYEEGSVPLSELDQFDAAAIWPVFLQAFENALADEIRDHNVAGFKSVVCYRTGLDVYVADEITVTTAGHSAFKRYLKACARGNYRINLKGLNDCLVISTCKLIAANFRQTGISKPIQFHTGMGDNDMSLLKSNPAHMQPLIAAFPDVNFVILHSSYPYTREAGYLATVYKNAYLDIGEIFPMVSIEGQVSAIKQSMELTPFSKLLWSTDGHHFPETYWLGNKQFRQVLYRVFKDLLAEDVITLADAIEAVRDIMFKNSNKLYNLKISLEDDVGDPAKKSLALLSASANESVNTTNTQSKSPVVAAVYDVRYLRSFLDTPYGKFTSFFLVQWVDYLGTLRCRSFPLSSFSRLVKAGNRIGISRGNLHTLQDDSLTDACNAVGQVYVEPDLTTLRPVYWKDVRGATTAMASFKDIDGSRLDECPRCILQGLADRVKQEHNLAILVGFELEVTFLRLPAYKDSTEAANASYTPIEATAAHAWGTLSAAQAQNTWPLIAKLVDELQAVGIPIEHFHSESGQGQYEFVLPPLPLVTAVDVMYQAKQAIQLKAHRWGLRATFHPTPIEGLGTGLHAHISLNSAEAHDRDSPRKKSASISPRPPSDDDAQSGPAITSPSSGAQETVATAEYQDTAQASPSREKSFWSAVLSSLPGICAFTLPSQASYTRVADDTWSTGTWVTWGTENRETPLRRVANPSKKQERWEVRCLDGLGNVYLAIAAVVGVGMQGLADGRELKFKDCTSNPRKLSDEDRAGLGITEKLPNSLRKSLEALAADEALKRVFGSTFIENYSVVRKAETAKLEAMTPEKRRTWLIERY